MDAFLYGSLAGLLLLALALIGLGLAGLAARSPLVVSRQVFLGLIALATAPTAALAVDALGSSVHLEPGVRTLFLLAMLLPVIAASRANGVLFFGVEESSFRDAIRHAASVLGVAHKETSVSDHHFCSLEASLQVAIRPETGTGRLIVVPPSAELLRDIVCETKSFLERNSVRRNPATGLIQSGVGGLVLVVAFLELGAFVLLPLARGFIAELRDSETEELDPHAESGGGWVGAQAPDFQLETLDGESFRLSSHLGKDVVILNFFATWCGPCTREMPELVRFHQDYREAPLVMLGIDAREAKDEVRAFGERFGVGYDVAIDQGAIMDRYGVRGFPTTVVIGLDGRIQQYRVGLIRDAERAFAPEIEDSLLLSLAGYQGTAGGADDAPAVLLSYSFADASAFIGPERLAVRRAAKGETDGARESRLFRFSGHESIEIRDRPGNGGFPEIQGGFPLATEGRVYVHFALLTAEPAEEMHVALAGPEWFQPKKDGIGFWLQGTSDALYQVSAGTRDRLLDLEPFVWYLVDLWYDVDAGTYDLRVRKEGEPEAVVLRSGQPNASGHPGSSIDKISFIGDRSDSSAARYFVDDVIVSRDEDLGRYEFDERSRRKHFCDELSELRALERRLVCPPALGARDFPGPSGAARLRSLIAFSRGCAALRNDEPERALAHFAEASKPLEAGGLPELASVLALSRLGRGDGARALLAGWRRRHPSDLRAAGVEAALARSQSTPTPEERYSQLLAESDFTAARDHALGMAAGDSRPEWTKRAGDASFCGGEPARARELYQRALAAGLGDELSLLDRLADVFHVERDLAGERGVRARIAALSGEEER